MVGVWFTSYVASDQRRMEREASGAPRSTPQTDELLGEYLAVDLNALCETGKSLCGPRDLECEMLRLFALFTAGNIMDTDKVAACTNHYIDRHPTLSASGKVGYKAIVNTYWASLNQHAQPQRTQLAYCTLSNFLATYHAARDGGNPLQKDRWLPTIRQTAIACGHN